jgi:dTDP-4-dehydrorhamnose reductase
VKILVLGAQGQLAQSLAERGRDRARLSIETAGRDQCDLAMPGAAAGLVMARRPDLVVNAAAYTAVDKAESEEDAATRLNAGAPAEAAAAAHALAIPFVQVSTDYVFDGSGQGAYRPSDAVAPLGAYGRSKRAGEVAVGAANPLALILRTAWVYSPFGNNFVRTMLRLAESRDEVGVVADQFGSPTSALDLADAILTAAEARADDRFRPGIYHVAGSGEASWADVAEAVFAASAARGGPTASVRRIATSDYPTPARRPANSRLDSSDFEADYGFVMPDWRGSVDEVVGRLVGGAQPA